MIDCVLEMKVDMSTFTSRLFILIPSCFRRLQVYSRMPQVANQSYAKAAQLF